MPVGKEAISPAIPNAQEPPGGKGYEQAKQVQSPHSGDKPSEKVEEDQARMEYIKKYIGDMPAGRFHFLGYDG